MLRMQQLFRSCSELERWSRLLQVYISPFAVDPRRHRIAGATVPMSPNTRLTHLLPERTSALVLIESSLRRHPCLLSNKSIGFPFDSASLHCIQNTWQQVFKPQASPLPSHQRRIYPTQQHSFPLKYPPAPFKPPIRHRDPLPTPTPPFSTPLSHLPQRLLLRPPRSHQYGPPNRLRRWLLRC